MMKISGLVFFVVLFVLLIAGASVLGSYDPVMPEMAHSQAALTVGTGLTAGISTALNWMFKLALGGVCTGFGFAAFNEARNGYKLWKRQANAGRWQGGPNAGYQRQAQSPRATMTDKLLLMLAAGNHRQEMSGRVMSRQPIQDDDDDLRIEV
jgi:hypothetical protein